MIKIFFPDGVDQSLESIDFGHCLGVSGNIPFVQSLPAKVVVPGGLPSPWAERREDFEKEIEKMKKMFPRSALDTRIRGISFKH